MSLVILAGCSTRPAPSVGIPTTRGGTLHLLLDNRIGAWDPQQMGSGPASQFAVRTYLRTLTAQAPAGVGFLPGLVGDLATTTGQVQDGGRTWAFSLVGDAPWQDGRFVTCADLKYGISRSFATERLGASPNASRYAVQLLDIPTVTGEDGGRRSAYQGPYSGKGQDLYDKAVTCVGQRITFHLNAPRYDFDQIVSLPEFAPYRKDQDTDRVNAYSIFSSGPYMLEGIWKPGEGGRFVRNRKWMSLDDPVRLAWPDVIEVEEGLPTTTVVQRIVDSRGDDRNGITWADAPAAMSEQLRQPQLASRVSRPDSGKVDLLLPNLATPAMADATVRRALAMSTAREVYAAAQGSPMTATTSCLATSIPGRPETGSQRNPVGGRAAGDPAAARALLVAAGVTLPVPVRVAYPASAAADRAFGALQQAWQQAGFSVTLVPLAGASSAAGAPAYDLSWASLSAAWPSGSAVLPRLIAGRVSDPSISTAVAEALATPNAAVRNAAWGSLDVALVAAGDVIPLAERQRVLVHGSGVQAYQDNVLLGGLPDLSAIEVQH